MSELCNQYASHNHALKFCSDTRAGTLGISFCFELSVQCQSYHHGNQVESQVTQTIPQSLSRRYIHIIDSSSLLFILVVYYSFLSIIILLISTIENVIDEFYFQRIVDEFIL